MTALVLPLGPAQASDAGRGLVRLPRAAMARLGLRPGDTVALTAGRRTHARVLPDPGGPEPSDRIGVDALLAANLGARWGAQARLEAAALPALSRLVLRLAPGQAAPADLAPLLADLLVTEGDRLAHGLEAVTCEPAPAGHVGPATRIETLAAPAPAPGYRGIAGLARQIAAVEEMVELPIRRPDLFEALGIAPPRGVLLSGPPGTGKTLLARQVAEQGAASFFEIAAPEILSKHYGESEAALRKLFESAARAAPAVIFIDEIDAIAPRRDGLSGEKQVERRVVAQLLALMDGLTPRGRVVVMAATNLPDALDPALRRPGRFDREIAFGAPDAADRAAILGLHLARARLAPDVDLGAISAAAHGFVGADLAALAAEAGLAALARAVEEAGGLDRVEAATLAISARDLAQAMARIGPSALRDTLGAGPPVGWHDIGGLDQAKAALTEAVIWPMTHPGPVAALGLSLPRGILLAGPPGTGKTLLVRALAAESGMNFMALPPSRSVSPFLGEAERTMADLFRRARAAAPSLIFIDEIDTLAPRRGRADSSVERLLAQLLIEIDGLSDNAGLVLIGATNRPDAIDPALIRPGRFDLVIAVDPPDARARAEILAVHARGRPLAPGVDLVALAEATAGFSGAALANLVTAAARGALVRLLGQEPRPPLQITPADFDRALALEIAADQLRHGPRHDPRGETP